MVGHNAPGTQGSKIELEDAFILFYGSLYMPLNGQVPTS